MTARQARDAQLDLLEIAREDFVALARNKARELATRNGTVTIDDVRAECPPPPNVDPRVMGAIMRAPEFVKVGYRSSARKTCHARPVAVFRLVA